MSRTRTNFLAALLVFGSAGSGLRGDNRELTTLDLATKTVKALGDIPLKGIPKVLLRDSAAVAIVPRLVKAGFVVGAYGGHGVLVVHRPDGSWSDPVFIALEGAGIGTQAGIEKTELVLVFKTSKSMDRALSGSVSLGGDVAIAAGPVGRDTQVASDRLRPAEIYSYSRSHGLFAGVSLDGSRLRVETVANKTFYALPRGEPADVLARGGLPILEVETLKAELKALSNPRAETIRIVPAPPPAILIPPPPPAVPPAPVPVVPSTKGPGG